MTRLQLLVAIMVSLFFASCIGTGNKYLTEGEKQRVVLCNEPIGSLTNDGKVWLVSIEQMQEFLKASGKVLVYEYASFCKSDHCLSPTVVEDDCTKAGIRFCLVAESYEGIFNIPVRTTPILAIEPTALGKKIGRDCSKAFFDRLTGTTWKTRGYGRYYLFAEGTFRGCYNDYQDALNPFNAKNIIQ